jgi:hypothetical protein
MVDALGSLALVIAAASSAARFCLDDPALGDQPF